MIAILPFACATRNPKFRPSEVILTPIRYRSPLTNSCKLLAAVGSHVLEVFSSNKVGASTKTFSAASDSISDPPLPIVTTLVHPPVERMSCITALS